MTSVTLPADLMALVRSKTLGGPNEACAILLAATAAGSDNSSRLLVRECVVPSPAEYTRQGPLEAELDPHLVAKVARRARDEGLSLVFVHSHLGTHRPRFSQTDSEGERRLADFLNVRTPGRPHGALVLSTGGAAARLLGGQEAIPVVAIGEHREEIVGTSSLTIASAAAFDRQVRAFGATGQETLRRLTVGIVGLGGMGSLVALQLAHLGIERFVLIDPDIVEVSNVNRVANTTAAHVGRPKVEVARDYIQRLTPHAAVEMIKGDVTRVLVAHRLTGADVIFGCTDSHGSRAVIQQVAYQYLIPCIDTGTTIVASGGQVKHIVGRAQLLAPGMACLTCTGLLDSAEVRKDMLNEEERKADPYIQGAHEPAPAVVSINGTVASLAVSMFLSVVAGVPIEGRYLLYDGVRSMLRRAHATPDASCYICSTRGALARGDSWPILGRSG